MRNVLVYRSEVLAISETFIVAQIAALKQFKASVAGLWPAKTSLTLPVNHVLLCNSRTKISLIRKAAFQLFGFAPGFYAKVRRLNANLIHAHFAPDASNAMLLARRLRLPLVVTLHGQDVTRFDSVLRQRLEGRTYLRRRQELGKRTAVFICVSNFIKAQALARGFPEHKLRVHYIGIDRERFQPSYNKRERKLVVFVGRLVPKKGCSHLLEAMHIVQRLHPDARAVVIGEGPERRALMVQAERLNVRCDFLGAQNSQQVNEWLERARVFCTPSVTAPDGDSEGLGMVFAEAQATGLPVVSFAHGGIPEVVKTGVTGLLAPERDDALLAAHITRLIEDDTLWSQFSSEGINWVREQFDIQRQTKILEDIYNEVLSRGSRT